MEFIPMGKADFDRFHQLAVPYYREGEDAQTPQAEIDGFIQFLFSKIVTGEIRGLFAMDGCEPIGFALWAVDTEDFAFSEIPGMGTILEIGITPPHRGSGHGREILSCIEQNLQREQISRCYVSAYGPAQGFWKSCGYSENGQTASNGLPIMTKTIG